MNSRITVYLLGNESRLYDWYILREEKFWKYNYKNMEPEIKIYETSKNNLEYSDDSNAYRTNGTEYSKNDLTGNGKSFIN